MPAKVAEVESVEFQLIRTEMYTRGYKLEMMQLKYKVWVTHKTASMFYITQI